MKPQTQAPHLSFTSLKKMEKSPNQISNFFHVKAIIVFLSLSTKVVSYAIFSRRGGCQLVSSYSRDVYNIKPHQNSLCILVACVYAPSSYTWKSQYTQAPLQLHAPLCAPITMYSYKCTTGWCVCMFLCVCVYYCVCLWLCIVQSRTTTRGLLLLFSKS